MEPPKDEAPQTEIPKVEAPKTEPPKSKLLATSQQAQESYRKNPALMESYSEIPVERSQRDYHSEF